MDRPLQCYLAEVDGGNPYAGFCLPSRVSAVSKASRYDRRTGYGFHEGSSLYARMI